MAVPLRQRQKSFVNRMIQGSLLWRLGGYWLVYNLLLWHVMFLLHVFDYEAAFAESTGPASTYMELYAEFSRAHLRWAVCAAAIFPLFVWDALRLSHRIAGPLKRFRDALEGLQRGETVAPLTLRRDDLLVEYQHAFNRYLSHLQKTDEARRGTPTSVTAEAEADWEPATNPLIRELETIRAEIQHVAGDSRSTES